MNDNKERDEARSERDEALRNLEECRSALRAVGHNGSEWRTCERCSTARTHFIQWLATYIGFEQHQTSVDEMKAAVKAAVRREGGIW